MSQIIIDCPRCDEETHVDMSQNLTSQRCEKCGLFLYGADTGIKPEPEKRRKRKKRWRSLTSTTASETKQENVDTTDAFQRRGWQVWYLPMVGIGLLLVVGLIWWLVQRARKERGLDKDPEMVLQTSLQKSPAITPAMAPASGEATSQAPDAAWAKQAHEISSKFLKATTAAELLTLVRNVASVEPSIQAYAAKPDALPISPAGSMDILYAPEENGRAGTLAMLFFQNKQDRLQGLVLSETPEGLKVDWPSFSGEGDLTVEEFLAKKPTEPTLLRVAARLDDYYNFKYQDRDLYACVRLSDYPETKVFYGYISKATPLEQRIAHLPTQNHSISEDLQTKPQPLTIRARFPLGSESPNQVEILEIIGNGWYVP
jgi:hypothetical protein